MSGMTKVGSVMADMPETKFPTPSRLGDTPVYEARRSESIASLANALLSAQRNLKHVSKDADNPFFNSRYADLGACMDAVKEAYNAENVSIIQRPLDTDGTTICIETILLHTSGEFLSGVLRLKPIKADPQGLGSCLTYARRYALGAITGLVTEEDDDGNAASQAKPAHKPPTQAPLRKPPIPPPAAPKEPLHEVSADHEDRSWLQTASVGYIKHISQSKKLTQKGQPFGDITFDLSSGTEVTATWFGFSDGWTFERLRDEVVATGRAVFFTLTPPSNPKYRPTLEHLHVEDEPDAAE